jgi:hypothetical protein
MTLFETPVRKIGFVIAIVIMALVRPRFGKDYGSMGLWAGIIFFAVMLATLGLEAAVKRLRK